MLLRSFIEQLEEKEREYNKNYLLDMGPPTIYIDKFDQDGQYKGIDSNINMFLCELGYVLSAYEDDNFVSGTM